MKQNFCDLLVYTLHGRGKDNIPNEWICWFQTEFPKLAIRHLEQLLKLQDGRV